MVSYEATKQQRKAELDAAIATYTEEMGAISDARLELARRERTAFLVLRQVLELDMPKYTPVIAPPLYHEVY